MLCDVYAATTLVITTVWTYYSTEYSLRTLGWCMFFPGLFAPWFTEDPYFLWNALGIERVTDSLVYTVVAVFYVLLAVSLTLAVGLGTGWGTRPARSSDSGQGSHDFGKDLFAGFLRAAGEEIGWRCYLLPCLLTHHSTGIALVYSGLVWTLFHLPAMILLTGKFHIKPRWRTVTVQMLSCMVYSVSFAWVAIKSGFSLWPPTVMHFLWNVLNPVVCGSIYTNQPGRMITGEQWLINGEGLAGSVAGLVLAGGAIWDLGLL